MPANQPQERVGIAELAKTLNQSESQVRRYFGHGVYFTHEFGGANGQAKLTSLASAHVRLKARGLLATRVQKPIQLASYGEHLKAVCGDNDNFITERVNKGDNVDSIADDLASNIYARFYKKS